MVECKISTRLCNVWTRSFRPQPERAGHQPSQAGEGWCLAASCLRRHPEPPVCVLRLDLTMTLRSGKPTESCSVLFTPSSAVNESGELSQAEDILAVEAALRIAGS